MLIKKINLLLLLSFSLSLFSCADDTENTNPEENKEENETPETEEEQRENENEVENKTNVLLIIADDMGLDATPGYDVGDQKPNMPTLQSFIDNGIHFTNLWSAPTRSTILTGKYGFKTNMLKVGDVLSNTETSLQSYIKNQTNDAYAQAVIGKWHLSSSASHPAEMGVEHYEGLLSGTPRAYDNWQFTQNENTTTSNEYITSKYTDLAIDWLSNQTKPWFLWLAHTAPHSPLHLPPLDLHDRDTLPSDQASVDAPVALLFSNARSHGYRNSKVIR